jgi:hypothetical protein
MSNVTTQPNLNENGCELEIKLSPNSQRQFRRKIYKRKFNDEYQCNFEYDDQVHMNKKDFLLSVKNQVTEIIKDGTKAEPSLVMKILIDKYGVNNLKMSQLYYILNLVKEHKHGKYSKTIQQNKHCIIIRP